MKGHITYQRLYGLILLLRFIFLSDTLSLKGRKLDFYGRRDAYVSLTNTIPELGQFTACTDLVVVDDNSSYWLAFSYITKNTLLGREDIDLGLAGDHQQLILYNLGKTFNIRYHLTPFQWHTTCLIWDGVKGRLELFLNKERILVMTDQPHSLKPNGTLVLGHFPKNGDGQVTKVVPRFTGSLYHFQLWDRILESEELMKCLEGNVVSWEEDVWLVNKVIPTVDRRLRCFVSENMTIQETSTTFSQQIDLTTPSQITGLKPQKTEHSSTVMSKSMPAFDIDYSTISHSDTTSPVLETMTSSKFLKTSLGETATFAADGFSTSAAMTLPTQSTSIHTTTDSMKITKSPSSESTKTTKMAEAMATETFHPTAATNLLSISGLTKNSIASQTPAIEAQSAVTKTTSLFSTIESTSLSTTSWPKHRSTDIAAFPISTSGQEFISTTARTVSWSTVDETSAISTGIGTASAFPPGSLLISTAAPVESPRNQTASALAMTDREIAFTVHSVMPIETTPALRTVETESTFPNPQDVSLPSMEDAITTSMPKETSSIAFSSMTSSPITGTQSMQTIIDAESTHTALTPGITLAPTVAETMLSPTITGPIYTQNTPTAGEDMLTLISTKSASTSKASESGSTSLTGETAHRFSHRSTTWTSRPGPTLLTSMQTTSTLTFVPNENVTSALHWKTSNADHSSTTANVFTPPEASAKSKATTSMEAAMARHTIAISKSTSPRFSNSSTVSGTTSVTNLPEFQLTTLLTKNIPMSTVAANQLPSTPREMVVLPVNTTFTLADIKLNFSMEESTPKPTQVETNGTSIFGGMMAPVPESATTQRFDATVTRKETTSHHLKGKSTITAVADVSQFSTMLKVTDESAQTVTASVTVSPFPDIEKLTNPLDNKTATTEVGGSWLSTKLMTTTPQSSYNGTPEIFNSTHNYTVLWTSETPEGNSAPSPTSGRMQTFPKPLDASTTVLGVSFTTTTDRTAVSLSSAILPPLTAATHFSVPPTPVTHMFSLPVNVSAVTSAIISTVASNETKMTMSEPSTLGRDSSTSVLSDTSTLLLATMTTALVPPLSQTASTASVAMPTHRDSNYTSEATVISTTMTPTVAPSQSETLRPLTPVATRAKASLPSTPADTVTLSKHTFICSKPSSDSIPVASSTHVISTPSTPVTTPPIFQMEGTSTFVFSFPYTFSSSGDAVSSALGTTENSVVDENMPSHTSANKLPTSVDTAISQSSTRLVNTPVSTQLVAGTSTLSSDKEQMTISLGESHRTMEVTKLSPSENSFISYSQGTSSLGMTDMGFSETMEISSHQTHSLSAIPPGTIPDGDSASYPTSGSAQAVTHTMISSNTVDIHSSEMSSSLGNTAFPSQVVTITTSLFPERESTSALSAYPPKTVEMVTSPFSVTRPVSQHQNTSLEDITTSRTTRILSPVLISTTLSHLPSRTAQSEVTSVASSISESTRTFPKSLSPSTAGLSNANFTVISTDMITTALSIPNVPTTLLGETSMATSIPAYQMSSLPVNITAFTSKKVSDTPAVLTSMSSETTHPDCLKSPSMATSGPLSEISSVTFKESTSSPAAISSDSSTSMGSFSTLLPLTTPRTAMTIGTSTLDVALKTNAEPASKSRVVSFPFTTSEMKEVSSRITPIHTSSPAEPASPPMKTIPVTVMTGLVSSDVGTTASSLLSSKDTEAISSMPKTTLSSLLLTIPQLSQGDETTTLGISPAITNSSLPTGSRARVTDLPNTYSRTPVPASVLLPTPSEHLQTSLNIQVSPSLTDMNSTLELTTNHLSSNAGKMTSRSENTSLTVELTKSATSLNTPAFYPSWTAFSATTPSLISLFYSPHVTKENTEFSTTKVSPTSQMVGFPVMGTRIPSSNTQSLITTSWNTLRTEEYPFPISTTSHVHTPKEMQTETLHFVPGSLSTSEASQAGLVSSDVRTMSSAPKSGILPTFGLSESPSLSTSLRAITTTLADIKHTLEKATTSATHGATHPSNPSIISKATTSPMLTWILSSRPSGSSLATASNSPHAMTSSMTELSKATFPTSDMIPMNPVTKFTTVPFTTGNTTLAQTTTTPTLNSVTTGSPTSSPVSAKITDGSVYIPTSPEASSRTTVTANSRTASLPPSFSGMSMSPSTTSTLAIGSTSLPSPTKTSSWSRIPAASTLSTLITPKPTQDSLVNILTTASTATGTSFPLISTGVKHPSTATVSSLISPSFETIWWDSTSSFLSTETLTSTIEAESTVSFYNIEMSFFVFDEEPRVSITSVINEFVKNWLISIFKDSEFFLANMTIQIKSRKTSKEEMTMYRAILEQREGQGMATISHVPYSYVCQVILKANSSLASEELIIRIRSKIHGNLTHGNFTQDHLTLLVKSEHVVVIKLDPGMCNAEETPSKYKGTYKWLATYPTETAQTRCIKNADGNATRICSVSIQTGKAQWEKPRFKQCKLLQELPDKIVDLPNITISDENVNDVAEHILNLVNDSPTLDEEETKIIVSKVAEISKCDELSMSLTQTVLQIVNAVSEKQKDSASSLYQVSNEILRIIERVGHKMEFSGRTANLTVAKLALAVLRVDHSFKGMAFGIHSYEEGGELEIYLGNVPLERALASIYLPKSLQERIPLNNLQTILFNFFGQTSLFKTQNVTNTLTTCVVSASISDMSIQNLADPVVITLQHIEGNRNYDQVHCAFWDFETNNGLGGWNSSGCKVKETNVNYTICQCDHLTHFGVLMDLSRSTVDAVNERALVLITYTGCGISSIFLGIAIVTYIAFPKLRKDYPSKILINLCTALLMLNLAFLVNSWLSSFQKVGLCITAAVALHYFLLVSLTWMGLEAVHMYFALVRVFNIYIPNYILKFCLVGWGIPAITVTVILSVRKDPYGTLSPTTHLSSVGESSSKIKSKSKIRTKSTPFPSKELFRICWIQDDSIFYISVVAYFCLIFLMNLSMFCIVLAQLNSMKSQSQKTRQKMILHDLKGTISLMFLLGLTWGFSFFAWGPVRIFFLYLFAICNTLQGFLIFVFYCVMKENVREQWQTHLCCGWLRMDNSSDGNIRYRVNVGYKKQRLKKAIERKLLTPSLKSTATSSSFKSLASTQGTPSEISFANDDFDEDPYCFSSSSSGMIPNYITRILPVEIKMNSIRKQRLFPNKSQLRCSLSPTHGLEEMLNCETVCSNHTF